MNIENHNFIKCDTNLLIYDLDKVEYEGKSIMINIKYKIFTKYKLVEFFK